jgi:type II secretory pathway component GspD/PulD (secretin)
VPLKKHRLFVSALVLAVLLLGGYPGEAVCFAANDVNAANVVNAPATPSEALAANVAGYRIVNGIAILPILPGNAVAVQALLGALAQDPDFQGIKMTLYTAIGTKPKILLTGQGDEALRYAVQKLKTIMSRMGQPHRLVVSAYLREITVENDDTVGMSWFSNGFQGGITSPNVSTIQTTDGVTTKTDTGYTLGLANLPANIVGNLTRTISRGKVIVGSEITIVNGATAELKNDDSIPVPLGSGSQVTFNTQTISSDVKITPTIVKFNEEKPEESVVRLDVVIQLSVPTNTVTFSNNAQASAYTTQTLTATHYVRANNDKIIGGLFASDTMTKSRSGIPILMNIPLLKNIFSTNSRTLQHMASILTIGVRILPVDKETGYDY